MQETKEINPKNEEDPTLDKMLEVVDQIHGVTPKKAIIRSIPGRAKAKKKQKAKRKISRASKRRNR